MAVTVNDTRSADPAAPKPQSAAPEVELAVVAIPADMVELVAKNTFHTVALGAASGVTVEPGDRFHTPAPHAADLKRQGLAEDAPSAEGEAEA